MIFRLFWLGWLLYINGIAISIAYAAEPIDTIPTTTEQSAKQQSEVIDLRYLLQAEKNKPNQTEQSVPTTGHNMLLQSESELTDVQPNEKFMQQYQKDAATILEYITTSIKRPVHARYLQDGSLQYELPASGRGIYLLYATVERPAVVQFAPTEQLHGHEVLASPDGLWEVEHLQFADSHPPALVIRPLAAWLDASLIVSSNNGLYYFILISTPDISTELVSFRSNQPKQFYSATKTSQSSSTGAKRYLPSELDFAYEVINPCDNGELSCDEQQRQAITDLLPGRIYSLPDRTYIVWDQRALQLAPALFLRYSLDDLRPVNYQVVDSQIIVPQKIDEAILVLAEDRYVIIRRLSHSYAK